MRFPWLAPPSLGRAFSCIVEPLRARVRCGSPEHRDPLGAAPFEIFDGVRLTFAGYQNRDGLPARQQSMSPSGTTLTSGRNFIRSAYRSRAD
jgi:hypothetical protein